MGKSVIHPDHIPVVDACFAVTQEEYIDAEDILGRDKQTNGAGASPAANKMNEAKPHRRWAERVRIRSRLYGVLRDGRDPSQLLPQPAGA